jgi:hypothetical protein
VLIEARQELPVARILDGGWWKGDAKSAWAKRVILRDDNLRFTFSVYFLLKS